MKLFTCGFIHLKAEAFPTSGPIIKEKAQILYKQFPDENKGFKASECWLQDQKTFYSIQELNVNCEKLSEDKVEVTLYCDELADTIFHRGYCTDQIFNTDETSLNYKMLLRRTLAMKANREAPVAKK